jgi:hypothetical protein
MIVSGLSKNNTNHEPLFILWRNIYRSFFLFLNSLTGIIIQGQNHRKVSFTLITDPIFELILKVPVFDFPEVWWTPVWLMPFVVLAGVVLFLSTLHLAKMAGRFQGRLARTMLVSGKGKKGVKSLLLTL